MMWGRRAWSDAVGGWGLLSEAAGLELQRGQKGQRLRVSGAAAERGASRAGGDKE